MTTPLVRSDDAVGSRAGADEIGGGGGCGGGGMGSYTPNSKDDLVEITLLERFRIVKILLMILLNDPYHFFPHRQTKVWPPRGAGDR